jgi:hypothetical protein
VATPISCQTVRNWSWSTYLREGGLRWNDKLKQKCERISILPIHRHGWEFKLLSLDKTAGYMSLQPKCATSGLSNERLDIYGSGKLIKFRRTLTDIEAYGDQPSGKTSPVLLDLVRCCDWASGDVPCVAVHQPMLHGCVQRMLEHNVIIVDCLSSHRASSQ